MTLQERLDKVKSKFEMTCLEHPEMITPDYNKYGELWEAVRIAQEAIDIVNKRCRDDLTKE